LDAAVCAALDGLAIQPSDVPRMWVALVRAAQDSVRGAPYADASHMDVEYHVADSDATGVVVITPELLWWFARL
jgi:hypothetical protein